MSGFSDEFCKDLLSFSFFFFLFLSFSFFGIKARHSGVKFTVVVGFASTGDRHNHRQGTTFARADVYLDTPITRNRLF